VNLYKRAMLKIHLAVFLFGASGLFGKFSTLSPLAIVLSRTFFASLTLLFFFHFSRSNTVRQPIFTVLKFSVLGALLAFHWYAFFYSIKLSTVAIALLTFSSFPLFVLILESVVSRTKIARADITSACIVVVGIILVVPKYDLADENFIGAVWGILSGLSFAFLQVFNRQLVRSVDEKILSFYQNFFAIVFLLSVSEFSFLNQLTPKEFLLMAILGVFCTALAHTLFISGLKFIRAETASVVATLEPIYGILLAFVLLKEVPTIRTLAGGALILTTVLYVSRMSVRD